MTQRVAQGNARGDSIFVGRDEELRQIVANIRSGTHTLVVGDKGIGKSALVGQAIKAIAGELPKIDLSQRVGDRIAGRLPGIRTPRPYLIFIANCSPLGDCLREIAKHLWSDRLLSLPERLRSEKDWDRIRKWFGGLGRVSQQELIRESLESAPKPLLLVFDSLDRISPAHQQFLEGLFAIATVVAAAARLNDAFHYKKIWSSFSRIELGALPRAAAEQLVERLIAEYGLRPSDRRLFTSEILKSSAFNPFHIRINVWRSSRRSGLDRTEIRSLRRTEEGEYFNMGPIYIFGASIFTMYKILSIGMDNREFYIYFSSLGFFVYLTFRVFRNFFLFRPQKKR